jgi:MGT family glycosyltransferase
MAKYLFTMWDGGGNVPPELALAARLVARGHHVRVLADPTIEAEARAAGCEFSPWTTAPHRTSRAREHDIFRDYELKNPMEMIGRYIEDFLAKPAPRWIADTLATLDRHGADAIVTDFGIPTTLIAAEARGLASALILPNIWMYPTPGIPPMGPGFMPAAGPLGRIRDAVMRAISRRVFDKALPYFNDARRSLGLSPATSAHGQMQKADRILVLTSPQFDILSPAMPEHVRYCGPELSDPAWAEPWQAPWKDDDARPLIAVGLSSTFQDQVPTLNRIVDALSTLEARALVTLGITIDASEVKGRENVVVVPTAPHGQLFPQAAVVVTHCGHGTVMKALAAGVPLLCVPMGRDQNDTAARVVHAGAGLRIKPTASAHVIRESVNRLLTEATFRENAKRLARAIETREGCVDAIESLEEIVAHGSDGSRRSARRADHGNAASPSAIS